MPRRGLVLIGKPGAGKGTQGRLLGAAPGLVHVETGEILRASSDVPSECGRRIADFVDRGEFVPDDLILSLFDQHLGQLVRTGAYQPACDLLVLDGIPRTPAQAKRLDQVVAVVRVVHLRCDDDERLVRRVLDRARTEGRPDDREATIRSRLAAYARETAPILEHYSQRLRTDVDGLQHPLLVHDQILHVVLPLVLRTDGDGNE